VRDEEAGICSLWYTCVSTLCQSANFSGTGKVPINTFAPFEEEEEFAHLTGGGVDAGAGEEGCAGASGVIDRGGAG